MKELKFKIVLFLLIVAIITIIGLCFVISKQNKKIANNISEITSFQDKKEFYAKEIVSIQKERIFYQNKIKELEEKLKKTQVQIPFKHPIETKVEKCMKECNYTTACMSDCVYSSIDDWEKISKESISGLKKFLNSENYALLIESQNKWKEYKKAHIKFLTNTIGSLTGTIYINILSADIADIYEQRARNLNSIFYNVRQGTFVLP